MKRLTTSSQEIDALKEFVLTKFTDASKNNIQDFEITKDEVRKHIAKIDEKTVKKPTLKITAEAYIQMFQYVEQSSTEISWHGLVDRDKENNTYTIYHLMPFPQINSGVSTTTDEDEFAEWQTALIENEKFPIEDLRLHGHSHVNMQVYSSGIDDQYQNDIIRKIEDGDYYIFMVLNKRHEICTFIYDYDQKIVFDSDDITIQIVGSDDEDIKETVANDIKTYCRTEVPKVTHGYRSYYQDEDDTDFYQIYRNTPGRFRGGFRV